MSNPTPKDDDDVPVIIIINPKSAFRRTLERGLESPTVWVVAMIVFVVIGVVLDK